MYSFVFGLLKTNLIDFSMLQSDFDDSDLKDDSLMDVDETPEVEMPVAEGETQVKTEAVEGEEVEVKEETLDESVKMEMTENEIEIKEENIPEKTENDSVRDLFQKSILIKDFFHELIGYLMVAVVTFFINIVMEIPIQQKAIFLIYLKKQPSLVWCPTFFRRTLFRQTLFRLDIFVCVPKKIVNL